MAPRRMVLALEITIFLQSTNLAPARPLSYDLIRRHHCKKYWVLKVYEDQMADKEQICELCTVHKIVYINFMNVCKIHVNLAKTTFYLTK
jgi:hypothetical protein